MAIIRSGREVPKNNNTPVASGTIKKNSGGKTKLTGDAAKILAAKRKK